MVAHMAVATLIALWMRRQSLLEVVDHFRPSCNGSMLPVKKKVDLKLEHRRLMPAWFRFSPCIWQKAPNGMSLQFQG